MLPCSHVSKFFCFFSNSEYYYPGHKTRTVCCASFFKERIEEKLRRLCGRRILLFVLASSSTALVLFAEVRPQSPLCLRKLAHLVWGISKCTSYSCCIKLLGQWMPQSSEVPKPSYSPGLPKHDKGGYINLEGTHSAGHILANQTNCTWVKPVRLSFGGVCDWRQRAKRTSTKVEPKHLWWVRGTEESTRT